MSSFLNIFGGLSGPGSQGAGYETSTAALNARQAQHTARDAQESLLELRQRMDRLALICTAMWELLKETGMTEEQLAQKIHDLDLAQRPEEKYREGTAVQCPKCGRTMSRKHARCLYCGNDTLETKPFDAVR